MPPALYEAVLLQKLPRFAVAAEEAGGGFEEFSAAAGDLFGRRRLFLKII